MIPTPLIEAVALETRKQRFERNGRVKIFDPMLPATEHELADAKTAILTTMRWLVANGPSDAVLLVVAEEQCRVSGTNYESMGWCADTDDTDTAKAVWSAMLQQLLTEFEAEEL